jgi:hypothetical protein
MLSTGSRIALALGLAYGFLFGALVLPDGWRRFRVWRWQRRHVYCQRCRAWYPRNSWHGRVAIRATGGAYSHPTAGGGFHGNGGGQ